MSIRLVDLGIIGDENTGDILYLGGEKINDNFSEIYNALGERLSDNPNSTIYATGFFQNYNSNDALDNVEIGTQWEIDTSSGPKTIKLPNGELGRMIRIRNSNGSWKTSPVTVMPEAGESVDGIIGSGKKFYNPYSVITLICTNATPPNVTWRSKIDSIIGDNSTLIEDNKIEVLNGLSKDIDLFDANRIHTMKLLITGAAVNDSDPIYESCSEVLVLGSRDGNSPISTEYAELSNHPDAQTTTDKKTFIVEFINNGSNIVTARFTNPNFPRTLIAIKSIEHQIVY